MPLEGLGFTPMKLINSFSRIKTIAKKILSELLSYILNYGLKKIKIQITYTLACTLDRIQIPKEIPDYPFEDQSLPSYVSHEIIHQYLYNYSVAFGVYPTIKVCY